MTCLSGTPPEAKTPLFLTPGPASPRLLDVSQQWLGCRPDAPEGRAGAVNATTCIYIVLIQVETPHESAGHGIKKVPLGGTPLYLRFYHVSAGQRVTAKMCKRKPLGVVLKTPIHNTPTKGALCHEC